jgi:short-subunit dehydrogenase
MTGSHSSIGLVTGANKGIGLEIARGLGERGLTVLLGARDEERGYRAAEELAARTTVGMVTNDQTPRNVV